MKFEPTMRELIDNVINLKYDLSERTFGVSADNPISIYFSKHLLNEEFVDEGLIHTYPIADTIKHLKKTFSFNDNEVKEVKLENNIEGIEIIIPDIKHNQTIIKNALNACGYYFDIITKKNVENDIVFLTMRFLPKDVIFINSWHNFCNNLLKN